MEKNILLGGLLIEGLLLLGLLPLSPVRDGVRWIAILVAAGAVHFVVAQRAAESRFSPSRRFLLAAFLAAVLFRLTLLGTGPTLSDDAYRNVWDGRVQAAGLDPFAWPPTAPELGPLRDEAVWPHINHPSMRTVYPPVTLLLGRLAAELAGPLGRLGLSEMNVWKAVLLLVECSGAGLLLAGLASRGRGGAFLVYGWAPLAVFEFYSSGHADGAGVGLFAGAIGLLLLAKPAAGGALFAAALLVKPITAPLLLAGFRAKRRGRILTGAFLAGLLLTLPYISSGSNAFESLLRYQSEWEFNGLLHRALHVDAWAALPGRIARGEWDRLGESGEPEQKRTGRLIAASIPPAAGGAALLAGASPAAASILILGGLLLILPTIHPWYLTWLLPLLTLRRVRGLLAWFVTIPLVYEAEVASRAGGAWGESRPVQVLVLLPVLFLLLRGPGRRDSGEKTCIED